MALVLLLLPLGWALDKCVGFGEGREEAAAAAERDRVEGLRLPELLRLSAGPAT